MFRENYIGSIEVQVEEKMTRESLMLAGIVEEYKLIGLDAETTYRKTSVLLKLYRRIRWCLRDRMDDLYAITYESCLGDSETLSYLLNFAPDRELDLFKSKAIDAMKTKVLLNLIDRAVEHAKYIS